MHCSSSSDNLNEKNMFENTKVAIAAEIISITICVDPAPISGSGMFNVIRALKKDMRNFKPFNAFIFCTK